MSHLFIGLEINFMRHVFPLGLDFLSIIRKGARKQKVTVIMLSVQVFFSVIIDLKKQLITFLDYNLKR